MAGNILTALNGPPMFGQLNKNPAVVVTAGNYVLRQEYGCTFKYYDLSNYNYSNGGGLQILYRHHKSCVFIKMLKRFL